MGKNNKGKKVLDDQEVKIIRELIRNPRISDNQVAKKTKIPVMSVNRKRKALEEGNYLRYYATINERKLDIFHAKQLYILKFKLGITKNVYLEKLEKDPKWRLFNSKYISLAYLGEKDGHLALMMILDASNESQLVEEFHGKIIPFLRQKLGKSSVIRISTVGLDRLVRVHHNYLPNMNMENGKIQKDWPDEMIFVNEVEE
ncbi:MAG: winged helix-turn-helix transcriptional regulator [Candidatus Woesearchaeota archaeon]|jgi:DNA-binding Lrp family transcriptional regulator|nr:winged helix-turn-helix transcriptional regulator [Candidatus Woesearchaeota archaeon]MDP7458398.1 winged helix-turn-helix transcriptional regulator [Candidatus Woesearchaeota archaeon]